MRFLILDTYYQNVLDLVYDRNPNLASRKYLEQLEAIYALGFARAEFLPKNLQLIGHEADQVIVNADILQHRWALEHGLTIPPISQGRISKSLSHVCKYCGISSNIYSERYDLKILSAQVEHYKPDIILNCDLNYLPSTFLKEIKSKKCVLVGECAYPLKNNVDLSCYDLIVSASPHFVDRFRSQGVKAEQLRLGFEASILSKIKFEGDKSNDLTFIGNISANHQGRLKLLEKVSQQMPLQIYGSLGNRLLIHSALKKRISPPMWGYAMYKQLSLSRIVLNSHIDVAGEYGGNMRMYEATGVGAFLLTDWKKDLSDIFEIGKEIVTYHDSEECITLIKYYLTHEVERETIAKAGQLRTLHDHTYYHRMQEFVDMVQRTKEIH